MFWINDISKLYNEPFDFFPDSNGTKEERLNSITRLSLYITIALVLVKRDYNYIWVFICTVIITLMLNSSKIDYLSNLSNTAIEPPVITIPKIDPGIKSEPTWENPFMNATVGELLKTDSNGNILPKPEALNLTDPAVKEKVEKLFFQGSDSPQSISDFYNRDGGRHQFYSMPSTSIPGNREDFQNWLYKMPARCKEQGDCLLYEDLRAKRPVFVDPFENSNKISK